MEDKTLRTTYQRAIDKLIPEASRLASVVHKESDFKMREDWADAWSKVYHREMDRMAHIAGLRLSMRHLHLPQACVKCGQMVSA